jgi:vesicle coat complex subunit
MTPENNNEVIRLVTNSVKNDLNGVNEVYQGLALAMIGAMAHKELVEAIQNDVQRIALNDSSRSITIRKKATLTLLRMYRKFKERFSVEEWASSLRGMLDQRHLGTPHMSMTISHSSRFPECHRLRHHWRRQLER